ncbi:MAG: outer membrane lipoprotein carrier protein LolA [Terracidiphilus sp.]
MRNFALTVALALSFCAVPAARAAAPPSAAPAADDLQSVLHQLDAAAANFHTTTADFQFDSIQTDPIPDKDVQKGVVYYERTGKSFQMGIHINDVNGRPVPKVVVLSGGVVKLYEALPNQVTTLTKLGQYQSWFMLGFGASGKDLAAKWDMKYLGKETIDGIRADKLELVPKDPNIRKNLPRVILWLDTPHGVSVQQDFDEGQGQSRQCYYKNIKVNQSLPGDAFKFKTDSKTQYVTR